MQQNLWNILARAKKLYPRKLAILDGKKRLTYQQVWNRVNSLAHKFLKIGIKQNDRIAALLPNSLEYLECYYAAAGTGAILVSLNYRLHERELRYILSDSQASVLICHVQFFSTVQAMLCDKTDDYLLNIHTLIWVGKPKFLNYPALKELSYYGIIKQPAIASLKVKAIKPVQHVAQLYYTSGTTSQPKGVMLTHANVFTHALNAAKEFKLKKEDRWLHVAPMFHLADAWAVFAITYAGGCHVMLAHFTSRAALAYIQKANVTLSNLVPTMLNAMVKDPVAKCYHYKSLRLILSGGAPIAPHLVESIRELFQCEYCQTYGLTETSPFLTVSLLPKRLQRLSKSQQLTLIAKTGRPFLGVKLRAVDKDQQSIQKDGCQIGEIQAKGDTITRGYWHQPELTKHAFTSDGWFKTGDLATIDQFGYFNIVDRIKDMIVTGGENVYTTEVEAVLYEHPAVFEAAVFGLPDDYWGEIVTAAVVLKTDSNAALVTVETLIDFCRTKLAGFKIPRKVFILKALPKTGSGKIMKRKIKELVGQSAF